MLTVKRGDGVIKIVEIIEKLAEDKYDSKPGLRDVRDNDKWADYAIP